MTTGQEHQAPERWLTWGVGGIGTARFLADIGHEVPTALLPSLLTSTLGAPSAALGAIEGLVDALAGVARFGGGALADDPGRRRSIAVGTSTAVLSSAIGLAGTVWQVALLRAGAWFARGLRVPARNALLADVVPAAAYGRAYGFERAMDNLGAIGGPLVALGLVAALGVRWAIILSVIPGLLAAAAIVYAIRHAPAPPTAGFRRIPVVPLIEPPQENWLNAPDFWLPQGGRSCVRLEAFSAVATNWRPQPPERTRRHTDPARGRQGRSGATRRPFGASGADSATTVSEHTAGTLAANSRKGQSEEEGFRSVKSCALPSGNCGSTGSWRE